MSQEDPIKEFIIGQEAKLNVEIRDEEGALADPTDTLQVIIIDNANAEYLSLVEAIGALSSIEREGIGRYTYRHTIVSGDSTQTETWKYKWKAVSSGGAVAAIGSITAAAPGAYTDGTAFVLSDGEDSVKFEFHDGTASPVDIDAVIIDISAAADADAVAVLIRAAINGSALGLTASGTDPVVALVNDSVGVKGNVPVQILGSLPGSLAGMSGGRPAAPTTAGRRRFRVLCSDFPTP